MPAEDPVNTEAMIFTEEEVYMITGYCAEMWDIEDNAKVIATTEKAIQFALSRKHA